MASEERLEPCIGNNSNAEARHITSLFNVQTSRLLPPIIAAFLQSCCQKFQSSCDEILKNSFIAVQGSDEEKKTHVSSPSIMAAMTADDNG